MQTKDPSVICNHASGVGIWKIDHRAANNGAVPAESGAATAKIGGFMKLCMGGETRRGEKKVDIRKGKKRTEKTRVEGDTRMELIQNKEGRGNRKKRKREKKKQRGQQFNASCLLRLATRAQRAADRESVRDRDDYALVGTLLHCFLHRTPFALIDDSVCPRFAGASESAPHPQLSHKKSEVLVSATPFCHSYRPLMVLYSTL
eukprot:1159832-Pelagomonas_calceolata.AAC.18